MNPKSRCHRPLMALLAAGLLAGNAQAEDAETFGEAFTKGKFGFGLRWRMEHVRQDPFVNNATAIPLRARLNFGTASWRGFKAFAEYDYVHDFGLDSYNEGGGNTPDREDYPVIADPAGGDLNQAWLQYRSAEGNQLRAGRQRIAYDNQRFIGAVAWRQNEQTFDAVHFEREGFKNWNFRVAYVDRALRIFGKDVPAGKHDMNTWFVNVARKVDDKGLLTLYYYDIDNKSAAGLSNRTLGVRFAGKQDKLGYQLEFAFQGDTGNAPVDYDAHYWLVDLSWDFEPLTLFGGWETLGGDKREAGKAFRTPLATLHKFNGWADLFLTTPDAGLSDLYVGLRGKNKGFNWTVKYHEFDAAAGSVRYGNELDGSVGYNFENNFGLLFKAAWFDSGNDAFGDTTKFWVQANWSL